MSLEYQGALLQDINKDIIEANINLKVKQSSLKNAKFDNMTAEQVIKKYEEVLSSREKQIFELSSEIGQINQKIQKMRAKYENSKQQSTKLKNILIKKENMLKQELDNKELMFMQLAKKEKECDEIQIKINSFKNNKNPEKIEENKILNENKNNKNENINNDINKKKEEKINVENKDEKKKEADLKLLAKEKINQLTDKGEGMKKLNFAELLKRNQEKKKDINDNKEKNENKDNKENNDNIDNK